MTKPPVEKLQRASLAAGAAGVETPVISSGRHASRPVVNAPTACASAGLASGTEAANIMATSAPDRRRRRHCCASRLRRSMMVPYCLLA